MMRTSLSLQPARQAVAIVAATVMACVALAGALLVAPGLAGVPPAFAADQPGGADRTGSITLHKLVTETGGTAPGHGEEMNPSVLPEDAVGLPGVTFKLEKLSDDPAAAGGEKPSVTIDSPAMESFVAQTATTDKEGVCRFALLARGLYRVTETASAGYVPAQSRFLVAVPSAASDGADVWDVHVYPKSRPGGLIHKEVVEAPEVAGVGDTITWRITQKVPGDLAKLGPDGSVVAYGHDWVLLDVLDPRLVFDKTVSFKVLGANGAEALSLTRGPADSGADVVEVYNAEKHQVEWRFTDEATKRVVDAGAKTVEIELATVIGPAAFEGVEPIENKASVEFVNATGDPHKENTPDGEAQVVLGGVVFDKYLAGTDTRLPGAVFKVAASAEDAAAGKFLQGASGDDVAAVTDEAGRGAVGGLAPGKWWVVEAQAPVLPDGTECVRIEGAQMIEVPQAVDGAVVKVSVANYAKGTGPGGDGGDGQLGGGKLPQTSDMIPFAIAALVVALVAAALLYRASKRRAQLAEENGSYKEGR